MIKQAVIKEGSTPSEVTGKRSTLVKEGHAFAKGDPHTIIDAEKALEKTFAKSYNHIKDS